jgi:hypothetical protein
MDSQENDQTNAEPCFMYLTNYAEENYGISYFDNGITVYPYSPGFEPYKPIVEEMERELDQQYSPSERLSFLEKQKKVWEKQLEDLRRRNGKWQKVLDEWKSKWQVKFKSMEQDQFNDSFANELNREIQKIADKHFCKLPNAYKIDGILTYLGSRLSALRQIEPAKNMKKPKHKRDSAEKIEISADKKLKDFTYVLLRLVELGYIPVDKKNFQRTLAPHFQWSDNKDLTDNFNSYKGDIRTGPKSDNENVRGIILAEIDRSVHESFLDKCAEENIISVEKGLEKAISLWLKENQKFE